MPDLMDAVQQHAQDMADDALRAHAARPQQQGLAFCEDEACGEAIAPARRAMGARLCLDCQKAEEARASHFARWGRR